MMLPEPTIEKMRAMRLNGMLAALEQQRDNQDAFSDLEFNDRFSMIIEQEFTERQNRQIATRLRNATLEREACLANVDYRLKRKLDKASYAHLFNFEWVGKGLNIIFTGPTGTGKSFLASALCHQACLKGHKTKFLRVHKFLESLERARIEGSYTKCIDALNKQDILILDDFGIDVLNQYGRRDLLEIITDRHAKHATIVTSQYPVDKWHDVIGDPTIADAILDRLVHSAYRFDLSGDSIRKKMANLTKANN